MVLFDVIRRSLYSNDGLKVKVIHVPNIYLNLQKPELFKYVLKFIHSKENVVFWLQIPLFDWKIAFSQNVHLYIKKFILLLHRN